MTYALGPLMLAALIAGFIRGIRKHLRGEDKKQPTTRTYEAEWAAYEEQQNDFFMFDEVVMHDD